jgi:hypothetical protein
MGSQDSHKALPLNPYSLEPISNRPASVPNSAVLDEAFMNQRFQRSNGRSSDIPDWTEQGCVSASLSQEQWSTSSWIY